MCVIVKVFKFVAGSCVCVIVKGKGVGFDVITYLAVTKYVGGVVRIYARSTYPNVGIIEDCAYRYITRGHHEGISLRHINGGFSLHYGEAFKNIAVIGSYGKSYGVFFIRRCGSFHCTKADTVINCDRVACQSSEGCRNCYIGCGHSEGIHTVYGSDDVIGAVVISYGINRITFVGSQCKDNFGACKAEVAI